MPKTPPASRLPRPERPYPVDTPVHRRCRRLLGLAPEFNALPGNTTSRSARGSEALAAVNASQVTFQQPRVPRCFPGNAFEDAEDWLDRFECSARINHWDTDQKLGNVYFALEHGARTWFQNREASLGTWEGSREQLHNTFATTDRRYRAMRLLDTRIQNPSESMAMFAEGIAHLFRLADPEMSKARKLRYLMHGVK